MARRNARTQVLVGFIGTQYRQFTSRAQLSAAALNRNKVAHKTARSYTTTLTRTVCSFKAPRCLVCPVQNVCVAYRTGKQLEIPPVKKRPKTVHVQLFAVVSERGGRHLMKLSRGLWEFPMFNELPAGTLKHTGGCRHTITHHRLDVRVYKGTLDDTKGYQWKEFAAVPVSSLTRKILSASV